MTTIEIGQTWHDRDKRRDRTVRITEIGTEAVDAVDIATGKVTTLKISRLTARWDLIEDAGSPDEVEEELKPRPEIVIEEPKPKAKRKLTREQWLEAAVKEISRKVFKDYEVPDVRVSVGWPGGRGSKAKTIGQCWKTDTAADKVSQIFISPVLEDPIAVLETLVHEIVHAIDDCASGHKGNFKKIATNVGLTGKMTETVAGDELREVLKKVSEKLGEYPHAKITPGAKPIVQKTYMLKVVPSVECGECDEDYVLRMTQKWADVGMPMCPHGVPMELEG